MELQQTERTTLGRYPDRGSYDRGLLNSILSEALICHAGFVLDGTPFVMPMVFARVGDVLYLHGSTKGRIGVALAAGLPVCVTVTLVDGLVLARSAFHHSMNYRSAVILGTPRLVQDAEEKDTALTAFVEHVMTGRSAHVRPPDDGELKATRVIALDIVEASIKTRSGPPQDTPADVRDMACWAGELPLRTTAQKPVDAPDLQGGIAVPEDIARYRR